MGRNVACIIPPTTHTAYTELTRPRLDLLPSSSFQGRLPQAFISDYIHWYDNTTDQVIFRSRRTPWSSDAKDWRLKHDKTTGTWRLVQESNTLVDMASHSARVMSKIFQPLEDAKHIHVVLNSITKVIDIKLPRLKLGFFANPGAQELHSRQYRGMIVDGNQSIGTLVGLSSRLTLRGEHSPQERLVLIPVPKNFGYQSIRCKKNSPLQHIDVSIDRDSATRVYAYSLDSHLKRVLSSGDVQSQLFLCYLFAITSHCLPDPMTMRTGTESALTILQSAAVRSFDMLTEKNVELLAQIGGLSPKRSFYPLNERVMQQVSWDIDLPALSQHPGFRASVESILQEATKMELFHPDNGIFHSIAGMQRKISSGAYFASKSQH